MAGVLNMSAFLFLVGLMAMASQLGLSDATARLQAEPTSAYAQLEASDTDALRQIMHTASASLQATYTAIDPKDPLFPDVVDPATGTWHMDEVNANGAAGLLAGCLWSMYKLTGQDMWRSRALTASAALRSSVDDLSLGQAMGTLAYPAIRYAYEAETDADEKQLYLDAALRAADTLSKMFAYIPGVFKVRPTSHIADEAREAGAAIISPLAVFSSVEGAAAATGLLTWAARLPGGKAAWRDMALSNSRRIVTDHMDAAGSVVGTLVYKATSARDEPRALSSWTSPGAELRPASSLLSLTEAATAAAAPDAAAAALDGWLSQVAGQESSPELRQALATLALVQAARAAGKASDLAMFTSAVQVTASSLIAQAVDPLAMEPVAAAATAAALAELSALESLPEEERGEYALTARHVVVTLARHSMATPLPSAKAAASLSQLAGRWVSSLMQPLQQQGPLLRGAPSHAHAAALLAPQSPAILSHQDGSGGSMLADHLFLQALMSLTEAY